MSLFASFMVLLLILTETAPPSAASVPKLGMLKLHQNILHEILRRTLPWTTCQFSLLQTPCYYLLVFVKHAAKDILFSSIICFKAQSYNMQWQWVCNSHNIHFKTFDHDHADLSLRLHAPDSYYFVWQASITSSICCCWSWPSSALCLLCSSAADTRHADHHQNGQKM